MRVLFINYLAIAADPARLKALLTDPQEWPAWLPAVDRVMRQPEGYTIIRHHTFFNPRELLRVAVSSDLIRYESREGLIEYELLFRLGTTQQQTTLDQYMILTQPPILPLTVVTPLVRNIFADSLQELARLAVTA